MEDKNIEINNRDYKKIFTNITEKLFTKGIIDNDEKIKLINIINKDEPFQK